MEKTKIKVNEKITPMIYAYATPDYLPHEGMTKIGYTAKQTVEDRIKQQTHTVDVKPDLLWKENARYQTGDKAPFTDHELHSYLTNKRGVKRKPATEWFEIDGETSHEYFKQFANQDYAAIQGSKGGATYKLRKEQQAAVDKTIAYFKKQGPGSQFLWNAKPRFGKTLSTYDLAKTMDLRNVLVVTYRPMIANSWFDDFDKFISWQTNYKFVSETDALKQRPVLSWEEYLKVAEKGEDIGQIAFESTQGLVGSVFMGGKYDKLKWITETDWDLLVIDEAHEGIDTEKAERAFSKIKRKYTLHLSGTPFKALANGKFSEEQIYNWSYADEQTAKANWDKESANPYEKLPRLNMFTYKMSDMIKDQIKEGIQLADGEVVNATFDLNEFFAADEETLEFIHDEEVDKFLDALTRQEKYPFSTPELRNELKHSLWMVSHVASAKALAKKLRQHPVFENYQIVVAAGDGQVDDEEKADKQAYEAVQTAIKEHDKTITISVSKLTTGVTVKPWSAVLMLSSIKSPARYMQTAFRVQNPYTFINKKGEVIQKENAYVFDFDPVRTLIIFDEFANNLSLASPNERERDANIKRLLNFFPVIGEDDEGVMVELDAKQVLTIPRQLKSQEVVRSGFMNNYLFANIANIFNGPAQVREILGNLKPAKKQSGKPKRHHESPTIKNISDITLDEDGRAKIDEDAIKAEVQNYLGEKRYEWPVVEYPEDVESLYDVCDKLVASLDEQGTHQIITDRNNEYNFPKQTIKRLSKNFHDKHEEMIQAPIKEYEDKKHLAEVEYQKAKKATKIPEELASLKDQYEKKNEEMAKECLKKMVDKSNELTKSQVEDIFMEMEHLEADTKKNTIEEDTRAHLRGFTRTIPSFIMAYGDRNLTLQNFDDYTEDDVFQEVTGITEEQFRFLRDGGDYEDQETGETKHFEGHLFDEVVFNDSIQEFLNKKEELGNYFEEDKEEDIFDYIPPQKTNQIYTPKAVVKHMVDDLEANNPGIFDDPDKTFADLYMKSGLYITEIVKRLYRSKKMKELIPDDAKRIKHIMDNQVYGLAPTRIIYLIAMNYIFGFNEALRNEKHFKEIDTAVAAKEGNLEEVVQEAFGSEE